MRIDRTRRSAKQTVEEMANDLMRRPECAETKAKLDLIQTICSRMSWMDLFNRIQFRHRTQQHWMPYKD